MSDLYRKTTGYQGEELALDYYLIRGYSLIEKNFTIRNGELDLIVENHDNVVFVEVKVVNYVENLHDYITPKKLQALQRSIETYLWRFPSGKSIRLDVVFVKGSRVVDVFEGVEV